jgi:GGDEF domain-containing protein
MLDADHFKAINDNYGHPAGDAVLCRLAAAMRAVCRQVDVLARIGGEEFAVLLPSVGLEDALAVAERLRARCSTARRNISGNAFRARSAWAWRCWKTAWQAWIACSRAPTRPCTGPSGAGATRWWRGAGEGRMQTDGDDAYETLMQFLYRAPVALMQLRQDGEIEMLNPMAAQLLMPLSPDGDLASLFKVLEARAPDLAQLCAAFTPEHGVICESRRIALSADDDKGPTVLSLGLLKVDRHRLMAVLLDVTHEVMREQRTLANRLASAARVDLLTQLANRGRALELLQDMVQRARPRATIARSCSLTWTASSRSTTPTAMRWRPGHDAGGGALAHHRAHR